MFKNLRIRTKLIASFLITAAITLAVGLIGYNGVRTVDRKVPAELEPLVRKYLHSPQLLERASRALAEHAGCAPLALGPRVLRTETAGLAALAALQTLWGDFAGDADV